MVQSKATTVDAYLQELPPDRRIEIERVRDVVLAHLPPGYAESMSWGMISYEVPLERYPTTYNGKPLGYAALASQKNRLTLYLLGAYMRPAQRARLEAAYEQAGRRIDMGKSCLHFRTADELPLDLIGALIASTSVEELIALYEEVRPPKRKPPSGTRKR